MTKEFCDVCGERILDGNHQVGASVRVEGVGVVLFGLPLTVTLMVGLPHKDWKLCPYCFDAVVDEAYTRFLEMRAARDKRKEAKA